MLSEEAGARLNSWFFTELNHTEGLVYPSDQSRNALRLKLVQIQHESFSLGAVILIFRAEQQL